MLDALVIGGGPAGASVALRLARAGRRVALLEKSRFPRRKVCGEYVAGAGMAALRRLDAGLARELEAAPPIRRLLVWAGGAACEAPLPGPPARALGREALDARILELARASGAQVHQPMAAVSLERAAGGFVCRARSPNAGGTLELEARLVIAAHGTGPAHGRRPDDLLAFKARFFGARLPPDAIALAPFPGGYGGAVRLPDGSVTYACCVRRDALAAQRAAFPRLRAGEAAFRAALSASDRLREQFAGSETDGAWLGAGPLRPGAHPASRDGVLAVGNAAGEVHPLVGKGISIALESAEALCAQLLGAGDYEEAWRRIFTRRYVASACLARLALHPLAARRGGRVLLSAPALSLAARLAA